MTACFGTGEPTDNAKPFYDWLVSPDRLKEKDSGVFKDVKYAVFGLGQSKTYPQCYQAMGKKVDSRLQELGAQRLFQRGEGDDSGRYIPSPPSLSLCPPFPFAYTLMRY